jgi:hypothetical protein
MGYQKHIWLEYIAKFKLDNPHIMTGQLEDGLKEVSIIHDGEDKNPAESEAN